MRGINRVIILGNVGQEPQVRYTNTGKPVATLSIATTEQWTDDNGKKRERTEWHKVVCWGNLAKVCEKYIRKGRQIFVEGKLETSKWKDQKGNSRTTTQIVANNLLMLGPREEQPSLEEAIFSPREDYEEEEI